MKIQTLTINSHREVITKIIKEVLLLFDVVITGREAADYPQLSIVNRLAEPVKDLHTRNWEAGPDGTAVHMTTSVYLFHYDGKVDVWQQASAGVSDERAAAAENRLIKLNLYDIFIKHLGGQPAPWGILHGVRPTKIVHRWIGYGCDEQTCISRLEREFACSAEKAQEIVPMAFRQLPFLRRTSPHTVSVYVGIPFCPTRCLYCSFPSNILPERKRLEHFMAVLRQDIAAARADMDRFGFEVQNIYIGGGTPSALPDDMFRELLELVSTSFRGGQTLEFTVEAGRPDTMTAAKIAALHDYAVDRVSVNPQTMQQRTLDFIGRRHTVAEVVDMFQALRAAGIPSINMDIILGLPGETAADVADTMRQVLALGPDDVTLHALAMKRGSRLKKLWEAQKISLPGAQETRQMFAAAMHSLAEAGLRPYYLYRQGYMSGDLENVGCCRPGKESMYNIQIMEEHQTIIGIGGAAVSKVVDFRAHRLRSAFHAKDLVTYLRDIDIYIAKRRQLLNDTYGEKGEFLFE